MFRRLSKSLRASFLFLLVVSIFQPQTVFSITLESLLRDPFYMGLYRGGGPLCEEQMHWEHKASCRPFTCGHFDSWRSGAYFDHPLKIPNRANPISRNRTSSATYRNESYLHSFSDRKIVLSVGHNGFGNQMFQHYFGYSIARHMKARLYITSYDRLKLDTWGAPNTGTGRDIMDWITDDEMNWDKLPLSHADRALCESGNMTYKMRPVDHRDSTKNITKFKEDLVSFLNPEGNIKCIITVGYFINRNPCARDVRGLWHKLYLYRDYFPPLKINLTPTDMVMHLRCESRHSSYISHGILILFCVVAS